MKRKFFIILTSMVLVGGVLIGCSKEPVEEKTEQSKPAKKSLQSVVLQTLVEVKTDKDADSLGMGPLENNIAILLGDDLASAKKMIKKMEKQVENEVASSGVAKIYQQDMYDMASAGIEKDVSQGDIAKVLESFQEAINQGKDKDKLKEIVLAGFEKGSTVEDIKNEIGE
jgi:hypothetical protein